MFSLFSLFSWVLLVNVRVMLPSSGPNNDVVQVTMKEGGSAEDKFIRNLHKGDFFGEKALSGEEVDLNKLKI